MEENNRMGKTRDLFKKIRDNKGTFHPKMENLYTVSKNKTVAQIMKIDPSECRLPKNSKER